MKSLVTNKVNKSLALEFSNINNSKESDANESNVTSITSDSRAGFSFPHETKNDKAIVYLLDKILVQHTHCIECNLRIYETNG